MTKQDAARQWRKEMTSDVKPFSWLDPKTEDSYRRRKQIYSTPAVSGGGILMLLLIVGAAVYWFGFHNPVNEEQVGEQMDSIATTDSLEPATGSTEQEAVPELGKDPIPDPETELTV